MILKIQTVCLALVIGKDIFPVLEALVSAAVLFDDTRNIIRKDRGQSDNHVFAGPVYESQRQPKMDTYFDVEVPEEDFPSVKFSCLLCYESQLAMCAFGISLQTIQVTTHFYETIPF